MTNTISPKAMHIDDPNQNKLKTDDGLSRLNTMVRSVATDKYIKAFDKKREIASLIRTHLQVNGTFYRTIDARNFYFENQEKRLL